MYGLLTGQRLDRWNALPRAPFGYTYSGSSDARSRSLLWDVERDGWQICRHDRPARRRNSRRYSQSIRIADSTPESCAPIAGIGRESAVCQSWHEAEVRRRGRNAAARQRRIRFPGERGARQTNLCCERAQRAEGTRLDHPRSNRHPAGTHRNQASRR